MQHENLQYLNLSINDIGAYLANKREFNFITAHLGSEQLQSLDPVAHWQVSQVCDQGFTIKLTCSFGDRTFAASHPVLNRQRQAVPSPTPVDISTSIYICVFKAMAQTGVEIYPRLW